MSLYSLYLSQKWPDQLQTSVAQMCMGRSLSVTAWPEVKWFCILTYPNTDLGRGYPSRSLILFDIINWFNYSFFFQLQDTEPDIIERSQAIQTAKRFCQSQSDPDGLEKRQVNEYVGKLFNGSIVSFMVISTWVQFWPPGIVAACAVCVCVHYPWSSIHHQVCLHNKSSAIQARITNLVQEV